MLVCLTGVILRPKHLLAWLPGAVLILGLLAWCPWITQPYAEYTVVTSLIDSQKDVADGCGFDCTGCGVTGSRKTAFGYAVSIEYACGLLPCDCYYYHQRTTVWVSLIGTIHGLPGKS